MGTQTLEDWLAAGGARIDAVRIAARGDSRGLFAARGLSPGDIVAAVPASHVLTEERVKTSAVAAHLQEGRVKANDGFFIAFLLLEHMQGDGFWAPYIASLPTAFPWMPHYHAALLAPLLTGTRALQIIRRNVSWARAAHHIVQHCVPSLHAVTLDTYMWAYFVMRSRAVLKDPQVAPRDALVPFLDMCNHSLTPNARLQGDASGAYTIIALRPIAAGDEVTISYGAKSNSVFFARYGFTQPGNPVHETVLYVPAKQDNKAATECRVRNDYGHKDTRKMFALLREQEHGSKHILPRTERILLLRLRTLAMDARRAMSVHTMTPSMESAAAGDEALVAHAARACDGERAALDWCLELVNAAVPLLASTGVERAHGIGEAAQGHGPFAAYFRALAE